MSTTMNFINAIKDGDASGMEDAFGAAMAQRVSIQMDDMRVKIAQNMFNAKEIEPASTTEQE